MSSIKCAAVCAMKKGGKVGKRSSICILASHLNLKADHPIWRMGRFHSLLLSEMKASGLSRTSEELCGLVATLRTGRKCGDFNAIRRRKRFVPSS